MEKDDIIEIKQWFPLATAYRSDGKQTYMFPSVTSRVANSPSWTEFDEFARNMIRTLITQKSRMENVPINENEQKEPQEKKPWTREKNEMPKNEYNRVRYGGQSFNLYGDAPIITRHGGII